MTVRSTSKRPGTSCFELLWLVLVLLGGLVVARYAGARFGWLGFVVGFVAGGVASSGLLLGGIWLLIVSVGMFTGTPTFPLCGNGKCSATWTRQPGDYRPEKAGGRLVVRCRCGLQYVRRGRRVLEVLPDGTDKPYMVWRPFRGWCPDGEAP